MPAPMTTISGEGPFGWIVALRLAGAAAGASPAAALPPRSSSPAPAPAVLRNSRRWRASTDSGGRGPFLGTSVMVGSAWGSRGQHGYRRRLRQTRVFSGGLDATRTG